jgi:hypothetical protein
MFKKIRSRLKGFFFPPADSSRWALVLPYATLGIFAIIFVVAGAYGWDYTNLPIFCGTTCHTMPPQNITYLASPHANVYCTECHIGRSFLGTQFARKTEDVYELYAMIFHTYEFPIRATRSRPARETCEKCHQPEAFSYDSLRIINHYQDDHDNTPYSIYLILKTGGGAKVQGLGRGIHWHIVNEVQYYATNPLQQEIPYVRVANDDGTVSEYVDVESDFDLSSIDESQLVTMDCITCHNRVSHNFRSPDATVDSAIERGLIASDIPFIRKKAIEVLSVEYDSAQAAMDAIAALEQYYEETASDYYWDNTDKVVAAIEAIQDIYNQTVFVDQDVDWTTHLNNLGHINSPACFRCHDGKHLDSEQEAIRLECNLCHSIPVVATSQDFVTLIEISRGPEPISHLNSNWISLHHSVFDATCTYCHSTSDPGGTSNTSFCSNSLCHGTVFTYAGFDAPRLNEILAAQLPPTPAAPTLAPVVGTPTFAVNVQPIFLAHCTSCHNLDTAPLGLDLSIYASVMEGSDNGPVIVPGDAANSLLVQVQNDRHFANLTAEELAIVAQWIDTGAPEK